MSFNLLKASFRLFITVGIESCCLLLIFHIYYKKMVQYEINVEVKSTISAENIMCLRKMIRVIYSFKINTMPWQELTLLLKAGTTVFKWLLYDTIEFYTHS